MTSPRPIRSFTEVLPLLSRGKLLDKLDEELTHVLEQLEAQPNGKGKASLSLTLKLAMDNGMVSITPEVKAKLPDPPRLGETPFWTVEGALSVQHPSQIDMFSAPRAVPPSSAARETA